MLIASIILKVIWFFTSSIFHFFWRRFISGILTYGIPLMLSLSALIWLLKYDPEARIARIKSLASEPVKFMNSVKRITGKEDPEELKQYEGLSIFI